jgi:hypothetical protein
LLKDNQLIGSFHLSRQEVRPFTEKQITLITDFAAQAVVAIENARLLTELRQRTTDLTESLEQQTATSEVLQVISSSADELDLVFQVMLKNAVRICDAAFGNIYRWDGESFRLLATHKTPPAFAEARRRSPLRHVFFHSVPGIERCLLASATIRLASTAKPSPPTKPAASNQLGTILDQLCGSHSKDIELVTADDQTEVLPLDIVNGDDGLISKGRHQLDLTGCERMHELSRSSSNGRTNPNSTSSSNTCDFLVRRAGSEIP